MSPEAKSLTWEQFTSQKARRGTRVSRYATFVAEMKPKTVYNLSALYPKAKTDTLRSAVYSQAKAQKRKVTGILRDGVLFVALAEA